MKIIKGGFRKDNGKLVFSPDEQEEVNRIKTDFKDKATWFKVNEFIKYLKKQGKENEYNDVVKERSDSELLISEFSTGPLY